MELAMYFGEESKHNSAIDEHTLIQHVESFTRDGIGFDGTGSIVLRCGAKGCHTLAKTPGNDSGKSFWLPAYHPVDDGADKVVDPTGGGNAFLGGLSVGLARGNSVHQACIMGTIAASFAIEQVGMPKLEYDDNGLDERWNGETAAERESKFGQKTASKATGSW